METNLATTRPCAAPLQPHSKARHLLRREVNERGADADVWLWHVGTAVLLLLLGAKTGAQEGLWGEPCRHMSLQSVRPSLSDHFN